MPRREFKGAAIPTRLSTGIGAGDTSFNINDNSGWPTGGANGAFYVTLDPDTADEERVLVGTQAGGLCTTVVRAQDNTTAKAHAAGANGTVIHSSAAVDYDEANRHIFVTTDDNHTQYMRSDGTRHDLTARHPGGTVIPTATPSALVVGQAGAEGAGTNLARATHAHSVPRGTPVATGLALAQGALGTFADAGHVHTIGALSVVPGSLAPLSVLPGTIAAGAIDDHTQFTADTQPFIVQAGDPGAVGANRIWFDVTNRLIKIRNAANSAWELFGDIITPWTTYVPALPANHTEGGTGVARTGRYAVIADTCVFTASWNCGTTGNVTAGTNVSVGLPPPTPDYAERQGVGARVLGNSLEFAGAGIITSGLPGFATNFAYFGGVFDATHPLNWGSPGDGAAVIDIFGFYKVA